MEEEQLIAIKKWVKTAVNNTPTYTGTSRGTFRKLGNRVGHNVVMGLIKGSREGAQKKKYFTHKGNKVLLGFDQGAEHSTFEIKRTRRGGNFFYYFRFSRDELLKYPDWNESKQAPNWLNLKTATPWLAFRKAFSSYDNYSKSIARRFPKFKKYMGKREVTGG